MSGGGENHATRMGGSYLPTGSTILAGSITGRDGVQAAPTAHNGPITVNGDA